MRPLGPLYRDRLENVLLNGGEFRGFAVRDGGITGDEIIIGIGPAVDASVETWQVLFTWDVQALDDGSVVAVHPSRVNWTPDDAGF